MRTLKHILKLFLVMSTFSLANDAETSKQEFQPEYRFITSLYTTHPADNDIYNNKTNLLGLEYRPIKDVGLSFGYFQNSFYNDSYVLAVNKYFRPFNRLQNLYFNTGIGVVKGYKKLNVIKDKHNNEVLKKSKFNTNFGGDYIVGASLGVGYDVTERLSFNAAYVGAFIVTMNLKLN